MSDRRQHKYLSITEVERYDALAHFDSVKAAAVHLGLAPQTLYNWMSAVKKRYKKRRGWINATLAQTRRGGCLTTLLHSRRKMKPPDTLEDIELEEAEEC